MKPIVHWDLEQGTPEWQAMRAGKWGSSSAGIIMGGLETSGLASLIKDIAWGRVYGPVAEGFKSEAMQRGHLVEPEARDWYSFERQVAVKQAGIVEHARIPNVIWSPDGLTDEGGIEAKSPLHKAWMETKRTGKIPSEHRWQCRWAIWVGALNFLDYVSFHPLAGGLIVPAECSVEDIERMEERVALLEVKVSEWVDIITNQRGKE